MRVTADTPDRLEVEHRSILGPAVGLAFVLVAPLPLLDGQWPVSALMVAIGGGAALLFAERVRLTADRPSGRLIHQRRSIFGTTRREVALARVRGAHLATAGQGRKATHRVEIEVAGADPIALTRTYTSGRAPARVQTSIRDWLSG
ncbi:MAG: hypothetical protein ACU0BF_01395 [Paracoccaceae bacterium]